MTRPATELEIVTAERDALAREVTHYKRVWGRAVVRGEKAARQHKAALAEVERLTAERAENPQYAFRGGYIEDESGDRWWSAGLLAKVEAERDAALAKAEETRLAAYADKAEFGAARAKMREREAAAFARGVAAMREVAATYLDRDCFYAVRALPDPEDK